MRIRRSWLIITLTILISGLFEVYSQEENSFEEPPVPVIMNVVNDPKSTEFSPTISADGTTLIFESDREDGKWMLYQSTLKSDGTWSQPTPLDRINNACEFIAGPNLSYDGNTLYYTAFIEGRSESEDIYYSDRVGNSWSAPREMEGPINTDEGYEGFPSISSDERQFYFISVNDDYVYDKKNKENCFNIYVSKKTIRGRWGEPELLPEIINNGCVRDPKIMADNRTLLFSALTPGEKGKFNLFQSQIQVDKSWSEPLALDYVNTDLNNLSPTIPAKGDIMYFYSEGDLYTITVPPEYRQFFNATIVGYVRNPKTRKGLDAEIIIRDSKNLETLSVIKTNKRDGRYSLILNAGANYKIEFKKDGYLSQHFDYNLYYLDESLEERKNINLRSEADVGLMVYDKDLQQVISADISIFSAAGDPVKKFRLENYDDEENAFSLDVNKSYGILAEAKNFESDSIVVSTGSAEQLSLKLFLKPVKVKYSFNVKDVSTNRKKRSRLTLKNENRDEIIEGYSDEEFYLRQGDQYEVLTSGDRGYLFASGKILVDETASAAGPGISQQVDLAVSPIAVDANLILNNITFETNSANLSPNSLLELDRMVDFMTLNPGVSIEVSAHSDDVGSDNFNLALSQRRAASAKDYLVKNNVPDARIQSVGYGEQRPLVPNDSEQNRSTNRRVELKITAI